MMIFKQKTSPFTCLVTEAASSLQELPDITIIPFAYGVDIVPCGNLLPVQDTAIIKPG